MIPAFTGITAMNVESARILVFPFSYFLPSALEDRRGTSKYVKRVRPLCLRACETFTRELGKPAGWTSAPVQAPPAAPTIVHWVVSG